MLYVKLFISNILKEYIFWCIYIILYAAGVKNGECHVENH